MARFATVGESLLQLSPPNREPLESATRFDVRVVGPESNAGIAARRLGADVTWISTLPESPLGRRIVGELRRFGLDVDVTWSADGRVGLRYLEVGSPPRQSRVRHDRGGSPFSAVSAEELPLSSLPDADLFFATGVTPALSNATREMLGSLLVTARENGIRTAFDMNYRAQLWEASTARSTLVRYFPLVDVLFSTADDVRRVLDIDGPAPDLIHHVASEWDFETVVLTQGRHGSIAWHETTITEQDAIETETVDHTGTGDAFVGAFLSSRLDGNDIGTALATASAAAAYTRTIPGNASFVTPDDIASILADRTDR